MEKANIQLLIYSIFPKQTDIWILHWNLKNKLKIIPTAYFKRGKETI